MSKKVRNFTYFTHYSCVVLILFNTGFMLVYIFYNFFSKTSFSFLCVFCVFCFEPRHQNMCYHHLKMSNFYVILFSLYKSSRRRCSIKKLLLKISQYSQETTVLESLSSKVADSFCEYCEIFKNTYFEKYLRTATSESHLINTKLFIKILLCKNMLPERF